MTYLKSSAVGAVAALLYLVLVPIAKLELFPDLEDRYFRTSHFRLGSPRFLLLAVLILIAGAYWEWYRLKKRTT